MSSISLSVHESNDWEDDFRKIVKEVTDLYGDIDADESLSLDDVEVRVSEAFRSLEQKFLEVCVCLKRQVRKRVNLLNVQSVKHLVVHYASVRNI